MKGWVYIISNKAMPNLIKVGFSTKDPKGRALELGTGSPYGYVVEYEVLVENPAAIEKKVHQTLAFVQAGKEWFSCSIEIAIKAIKRACEGEITFFESIKISQTDQNSGPESPKTTNPSRKILKSKQNQDQTPDETLAAPPSKTYSFNKTKTKKVFTDLEGNKKEQLEEQYELAKNLDSGTGVKKNIKEAFRIFSLLAEQGHHPSLLAVGKAYASGRGTEKSASKSMTALKIVADANNPEAQYLFYIKAISMDFSDEKEIILLRKKWCGHLSAQAFLLPYLIKSSEADHAPAIDELGSYYSMIHEHKKAFELFKIAAKKGLPKGMRHLADCYLDGMGCTKNLKIAEKWYRLAAEGKDYTAKKKIENWDWYSQF